MIRLINSILLRDTATYDSVGVEFNDLKNLNYIYGENGSGKTTFSNFVLDGTGYSECAINWKGNVQQKALVYNKKFLDDNFHQHARLKGIFTLGRESHEFQEEIKQKTEQIGKIDEELINFTHSMNHSVKGREENETTYEDKCWALKVKYNSDVAEAFKGYRSVKAKFKEKCKSESTNKMELMKYDELKSMYNRVYAGSVEKSSLSFKMVDEEDVLSSVPNPIFSERIIGKEDIDVAKLISKLNISDWVRQGHQHLKMSDGICPFCQQPTAEGFESKLDAYFDESFNEKMDQLNEASRKYVSVIDEVFGIIDGALAEDSQYVDNASLKLLRGQLQQIHESNLLRVSQKASEPSRSLFLQSVEAVTRAVNELLHVANAKITEHNDLIDNIESERTSLVSSVWRFIADQNQGDHKTYVESDFRFEKAIAGLKSGIRSKSETRRTLEAEVTELERQISSVKPSIDEMNALLKSFSFTNFKFAEAEEKGDYRIIRYNGEDAKETLSEGEKTFVTFLYFIQLLNGSTDASRITENKVVIIDDPISSLDSNVLFIVSTLVRRIIEGVRNDNGNVKQVIILTHNIYFHKEVSFNKGKGSGKLRDETFWVLRKVSNVSRAERFEFNPVKTSYQLLWQELHQAERSSSTTVQNIIRRIIETYFKNLGGYDEDEIIDKFDGEEQVTCRALVSWINDGSHYINDDLFMESGSETIQKYLSVFESIFMVMGHDAHYRKMMETAS